ncbi:MAG: TIM barrel protein [Pseudomonadota bacterium]
MRFSANLGFLWTELALPDGVRAAKAAGFDAVEIHAPDVPAAALKTALDETGLPILGLNTARHETFGCAALPGQSQKARADVDAAVTYATAVGAQNIHVLAGVAWGPAAFTAYLETLGYACRAAAAHGLTILIEPINTNDVPGYFLNTTATALEVIGKLGVPNLKLMFDCYHVARSEGDVARRLQVCLPYIGHIQFAGVPDRGRPDQGSLEYRALFAQIAQLGWCAPLGAEYRPNGATEATLGWLNGPDALA